jgi:hypothetical protein
MPQQLVRSPLNRGSANTVFPQLSPGTSKTPRTDVALRIYPQQLQLQYKTNDSPVTLFFLQLTPTR